MKNFNTGNRSNAKPPKDHTKRNNRFWKRYSPTGETVEMSDEYPQIMEVLGNEKKYDYLFKSKTIKDGNNNSQTVRSFSIIKNREQNKELYGFIEQADNGDRSTSVPIQNNLFSDDLFKSLNLTDKEDCTTFEVERYEIIKEVNHAETGLNAKIFKHLMADGSSETILWADGSKGKNNLSDIISADLKKIKDLFKKEKEDSKNPAKKVNPERMKTIREIVKDWLVADVATVFGIINEQTKLLRKFALDYMYGMDEPLPKKYDKKYEEDNKNRYEDKTKTKKIDKAIGVSLGGIAISTICYTKGFEDTEVITYSGAATRTLHDKAIELWGDNGLDGANQKNIATPREWLNQSLLLYKGNNTVLIQKNPPNPDMVQHGASSYEHKDGKNGTFEKVIPKSGREGRFPLQYVTGLFQILKEYKNRPSTVSIPDDRIQPISDKTREDDVPTEQEQPTNLIPAVNMTGGAAPIAEDNISYAILPAATEPEPMSAQDAISGFLKKLLLNDGITPYGCSPMPKFATEAEQKQIDYFSDIEKNLRAQQSLLENLNHKHETLGSYIKQQVSSGVAEVSMNNSKEKGMPKTRQPQTPMQLILSTPDAPSDYELKEEVEDVVTDIFENFITRMGYDRHNYN